MVTCSLHGYQCDQILSGSIQNAMIFMSKLKGKVKEDKHEYICNLVRFTASKDYAYLFFIFLIY